MCEPSEDIEEFIEYELSKDSDLVEEVEYISNGEEIVEVLEDDEEEVIIQYEEEDDLTHDAIIIDAEDMSEYIVGHDDEFVDNDFQPKMEEDSQQSNDIDDPSGEADEDVDEQSEEEVKPDVNKMLTHKGPRRYLLFDDLVATIVDYDAEDTPIVEFALSSGTDSDDKLPVECGICPDVMHKSKLTKHLKTHLITNTNRYQCIYCEETYKDYKYLAGHARRHMGIRPYVCEPCKLYFSTKQDLRVHHQRRHHAKDLICEICGKSFSQNTMLKRHREATHEKKRRFQCEHCPKAYYKNFSLQEHIRNVHMGKRRMLVCPFCGMECRDAHKMARHRKQLHLNQTHFECTICQEEFTDINYFDAHKRSIQCRNNTKRRMEEAAQSMELQQQDNIEIRDDEIYEIAMHDEDGVEIQ